MNSSEDSLEDSGVILLPELGAPQLDCDEQATGPVCEKCGNPIDSCESLVCRRCGWYASINAYVELDQAWEADTDFECGGDQEDESFSVPTWAWVMLGCVALVVAESIAARLLTAPGSSARTLWAVSQLLTGLSGLAAAQMAAFLILVNHDTDVGLLDIVLRPLRPWVRLASELPEKQWVWHLGASGLTAAVMAVVVIGSIPFDRLLDWGTKPPPKQNLMGAVMSQMQKAEAKDQALEEAIADLAGKQNLDQLEANGKPEPRERHTDDCVILGYRANDEGMVYLLVLGGEVRGRLQYVGQVRPEFADSELRELSRQLAEQHTRRPFVQLEMEGVQWVRPQTACRISYTRRTSSGVLQETKLDAVLGQLKLD